MHILWYLGSVIQIKSNYLALYFKIVMISKNLQLFFREVCYVCHPVSSQSDIYD